MARGLTQASFMEIHSSESIARIDKNHPVKKVIGPDTGMYLWQKARNEAQKTRDYTKADQIRHEALRLGYVLGFNGQHYLAHFAKHG